MGVWEVFKMDKWDIVKQKQDEELKKIFEGIELTEDEQRYLKWLWKFDIETRSVFLGIFKKLKDCKSGEKQKLHIKYKIR